MRSHRVLVIQPGIGRSKEILILNVDKGLCVSDEVHVLSHYGVVDQPAPLFVHVDLIQMLQLLILDIVFVTYDGGFYC